MTSSATRRMLSALLASSTILTLPACSSNGSTRVASVGQIPPGAGSGGNGSTDGGSGGGTGGAGTDSGTGAGAGTGSGSGSTGGTGSGGTGTGGGSGNGGGSGTVGSTGAGLLVTAGNAVIGIAGQHNAVAETVNHLVPGAQPVTGTVTAILRDTGQTLVDLGQGKSVAVQSAAGIVGEIVQIDLANLKVVSAPDNSSLLGVGVATTQPITGTLASLNLATGNSTAANLIDQTTATVVGVVAPGSSVAAQIDQAIAPVVNTATGVVTQATAGLTGSTGASVVDTAGSTVLQVASNPAGAVSSVIANPAGTAPIDAAVTTAAPVVQTAVNAVVPVVQGALNTATSLPIADVPLSSVANSVTATIGGAVGVTTGQLTAGSITATGPSAGAAAGGVLGLNNILGRTAP